MLIRSKGRIKHNREVSLSAVVC